MLIALLNIFGNRTGECKTFVFYALCRDLSLGHLVELMSFLWKVFGRVVEFMAM